MSRFPLPFSPFIRFSSLFTAIGSHSVRKQSTHYVPDFCFAAMCQADEDILRDDGFG
jgi:hypothetical protein